MTANLRPYQWQIGNIIFGPGTPYTVLSVKPQSYKINAEDFQLALSNETRMGIDTEAAQPIMFDIGVRDNAPMPYIANSLPVDLIEKSSRLLEALQTEWKAADVRDVWGQLKPLSYCDGYGVHKRIYGRPRKFAYSAKTKTSQFYKVQAEYARVDSLSYSEIEYAATLTNGAAPVSYTRTSGEADAWFRVLLTGPMSSGATVVVGSSNIQLQDDIADGVVVEVSSYPWARRVIDSNGNNLRTALVGATVYLDLLKIPMLTPLPMSWTATGTTSASSCVVLWRDAYNVL